jgi:flagellar basal-body rod protein FlgG
MNAQQLNVDTIANNLANVNTPGFKKARVSFQDMMYREVARSALTQGSGVSVAGTARAFEGGELKKTDSPLDVAIRGDGFIEVLTADGATAYTRGGTLQVNRDGMLSNPQGLPLKASIRVPDDAQALTFASDGRVLARTAQQANAFEIGRIDLARFTNPTALAPLGDNLFRPTDASGDARTARPGEEGFGTFAQGYVEASNVKLIEEMVELMIAQRAYEVSTKVIQASDEMMGMTNSLRRGG